MSDGLFRKIMNFIGQGGKAIEYFCFGPEYMFPGNCYSERAYLPDIATSMNKAHGMIAHAEDLLYPGKRPAAQVGILFPRSSFVWDTVSVPGELQNLESELTTACSAFFIDLCSNSWLIDTRECGHSLELVVCCLSRRKLPVDMNESCLQT